MKKILLIACVFMLLFSCKSSNRNVKVTPVGDVKIVEVHFGNSEIQDTAFIVPKEIPDSLIIDEAKMIEDYLKYEKFKTDSLYKVFQQDSINFRKITKTINGGYNGWDSRYKLWLNAIDIIKQYNDTVNR